MKDFFGRQEIARTKTTHLIVLFFLSVAIIITSVYLATVAVYHLAALYYSEHPPSFSWWNPMLFSFVLPILLLVILGGTAYKINELKAGGRVIAKQLGGRRIPRGTKKPEERQFYNVVEEMALASGLPVPDLYVMDKERGINAFAAGFGPNDAVISVTKGTLLLLNRDELQGVIAHEFSHILNNDILVSVRLMGWLHGILMISHTGRVLLRMARYTRGSWIIFMFVIGGALYLLGSIGAFFGSLIKMAVSRQREFLADASAVQFTRNPSGLASALKKIGGLGSGSLIAHPRVSEISHMYFSKGVGAAMATHPPLKERVMRLDPRFRGVFPKVEGLPEPELKIVRKDKRRRGSVGKIHPVITGATAIAILETVGAPMKKHTEIAGELIEGLPSSVRAAISEAPSTRSLMYAFLLVSDEVLREKQMKSIKHLESETIADETGRFWEGRGAISPRARLPLVDMAMPSLRSMSKEQYLVFKQCVKSLISADKKISFSEYALGHLLFRRLDARFFGTKKKVVQIYGMLGVEDEGSIVLTFLARLGSRDEGTAVGAFGEGMKIFRGPRTQLKFLSLDEFAIRSLDAALDRLAESSPLIKKKFLAACLECITFDHQITVEEVELFRVIADSLDCPVPPWATFSHSPKSRH